MLTVLIVAAALAAQGTAAAPPPTAAETAAPPAAKPEAPKAVEAKAKPKKVCVEATELGSLFKTRICATPEEWEKRRIQDTEAMSRPGAKTPSGMCGVVAC